MAVIVYSVTIIKDIITKSHKNTVIRSNDMSSIYEINRTVKNDDSVETLYIVNGKKVMVKGLFGDSPYISVLKEIIKTSVTSEFA